MHTIDVFLGQNRVWSTRLADIGRILIRRISHDRNLVNINFSETWVRRLIPVKGSVLVGRGLQFKSSHCQYIGHWFLPTTIARQNENESEMALFKIGTRRLTIGNYRVPKILHKIFKNVDIAVRDIQNAQEYK